MQLTILRLDQTAPFADENPVYAQGDGWALIEQHDY
jgi:hypothetical protein